MNMELSTWVAEKLKNPSRGSDFGFHYIQGYNENKRNWYLRHGLGLEPVFKKPPLLFGGTIHDAIEAFYHFEHNPAAMVEVFILLMTEQKALYEDPVKWNEDRTRGPKMLMEWANTHTEEDKDTYDTIGVEKELNFQLANGFPMTSRLDRLVQHKATKRTYIMETKTTGYSIQGMATSVALQDQATTYLLATTKSGIEVDGLIPDIIYSKGSVVKAQRPLVVQRTLGEMKAWEMGLIGLFGELYMKLTLIKRGLSPELFFPRNGKDAGYFGDDNADIATWAFDRLAAEVPPGYKRVPIRVDEFLQRWEQTEGYDMFLPRVPG